MKTRISRGFAVVAFFSFFLLNTVSVAAAPRERVPPTPRERIIRVLKEIRTLFVPVGFSDGIVIPKP